MAETRSPVNDWRRVFDIAAGFAESAALLHRVNMRRLAGREQTVRLPFLIPAVVCSAFSVELFMKCLLTVEGESAPQTHSLAALYARLSPASRVAVAHRFDDLVAVNPSAQAMKARFPDVSLTINDVLTTIDRVFEQWRYAYEGQAGSAYGLGELTQALRERVLELPKPA